MKVLAGMGMVVATVMGSVGCSPRVTVIDRHTVMEEEAAGEWPDFEAGMLRQATESGVVPFGSTRLTDEQKKLYNVLNGEMSVSR